MVGLGVGYNVFDGEELLRWSITSVRDVADHVVVVYQMVSNFGNRASPLLHPLLESLKAEGMIDELILYEPPSFTKRDCRQLVSKYASTTDVGSADGVAPQFLAEASKRDIAREACQRKGCTYFMSMDADEFYHPQQLREVLEFLDRSPKYDATACLMRYYYKYPTVELLPVDNVNYVPLVYRLSRGQRFLVAHPFPVQVDPTRVLAGCRRLKIFARHEIEMHHMSFVRTQAGMLSKLINVSNRANYTVSPSDVVDFVASWKPPVSDGEFDFKAIHPHPFFAKHFTRARCVPNTFDIPPEAYMP